MLKREFCIFLIVGCTTVAIDYIVYQALVSLTSIGYELGKGISFVVGTIFAYLANRFWTFGHNKSKGNIILFGGLYLCTLVLNISVNGLVINGLGDQQWVIQLAFLVATALSAALNFLGMKFLVFKVDQRS